MLLVRLPDKEFETKDKKIQKIMTKVTDMAEQKIKARTQGSLLQSNVIATYKVQPSSNYELHSSVKE